MKTEFFTGKIPIFLKHQKEKKKNQTVPLKHFRVVTEINRVRIVLHTR